LVELRTAVIRECRSQDRDDRPAAQQRWCLYTSDGKKLLGRHPSKAKAMKQERAIQVRKHGSVQRVLFRGAVYRRVEAERFLDPVQSEKKSAFDEVDNLLLSLQLALDNLPTTDAHPWAHIIRMEDHREIRQTLSKVSNKLRWIRWRCGWQPSR
jgi:hypothetical protein